MEFFKFVVLVFVRIVLSDVVLRTPLPNHILGPEEPFQFILPEDTFVSSDNSSLYYSVSSTNNWIKREFGSEALYSGYYFFHPLRIVVKGDYCFCADENYGLRIVDISTPTDLKIVSGLRLVIDLVPITLISVEGETVLLSGGGHSLYIIDVSDIYNPFVVNIFDIPDFTVEKMLSKGDFVFFLSDLDLRIYDISDQTNPLTVVNKIGCFDGEVNYAILTPNYHLIVSSDSIILIFNVTDLSNPVEIGRYLCPSTMGNIEYIQPKRTKEEFVVYREVGSSEIIFLNITNPSTITPVWKENTGESLTQSIEPFFYSQEDDVLFAIIYGSGHYQVKTLLFNSTNISNSYFFEEVEFFGIWFLDCVCRVDQSVIFLPDLNNTLLIACSSGGLYSINVTFASPSLIEQTVEFETTCKSELGEECQAVNDIVVDDYFINGDYVYYAGYPIFIVFDTTTKSDPKMIWSFNGEGNNFAISRPFYSSQDDSFFLIFTGDLHQGTPLFYVLDIGDKENIHIHSYFSTPGDCTGIYIDEEEELMFLGSTNRKIYIYDISDLLTVVEVFSYDDVISDQPKEVTVVKNFGNSGKNILFTGGGIAFFDVTEPINTEFLIDYPNDLYWNFYSIHYSESQNVLYGIDRSTFYVINVTDIMNLTVISRFEISASLNDMKIDDDLQLAYILRMKVGVYIVDVSNITNLEIVNILALQTNDGEYVDISKDGGYVFVANEGGIEIFGGSQLVLVETDEDDSFACGNITVTVEAEDTSNSSFVSSSSFWIFREYFSSDPHALCWGMGDCVNYVECDCFEGWDGETCLFPVCFNISSYTDEYSVCNGRGDCVQPDQCVCTEEDVWYGSECQFHFCWGVGSNNVSYVCGGHETELVCSGRGRCIDYNTCDCDKGYEGEDCDTWSCGGIEHTDFTRSCKGRGRCARPDQCKCERMYTGTECQTNLYYYYVMTPLLSVSSIVGLCCVLGFCCLIFCCCIFCFVVVVLSFCYLIGKVTKQTRGIRRFSQLKNFDLFLQEQELDEDTSIAHLHIDKSLFEIEYDEIILRKILGEGGSNSVVYEALWNSQIVAFKCFKTRTICGSQTSFNEFEREVSILANNRHPNILLFFGCSLKPPRVGILMEYCENGDLSVYIRKTQTENKKISFQEKLRICHEIILPMSYLHSRSIIHRDLKLENVLLDRSLTCKLMDFGLSRIVDRMSQLKTRQIGTSLFMAPEILRGNYDEKVDVFSFGMLCYIVMTENFHPYGLDVVSIEIRVSRDPTLRPDLRKLNECSVPSKKVGWLSSVIESSWDHTPENRPSFDELRDDFKKYCVKNDDDDEEEKDIIEEQDEDSKSKEKGEKTKNYNIISEKGLKEKVDELTRALKAEKRRVKELEEELERKSSSGGGGGRDERMNSDDQSSSGVETEEESTNEEDTSSSSFSSDVDKNVDN